LSLIPILAAETPADLALAPDQLTAAEAEGGAKPCDLRSDVEETVGNMHQLAAAREVTRLDVTLAQEAVGLTQPTGEQATRTCATSSERGGTKANRGWRSRRRRRQTQGAGGAHMIHGSAGEGVVPEGTNGTKQG
jgi:hypothetical protein